MRKLLSIAITSFMIFAFSNTAWCSVEGDWDITGKISVKVKIEGQRSEKSKGYIEDEFNFYPGGYFEMLDMDGNWAQTDRKFIVELNRDNLKDYYEDLLSSELGVSVNVAVIESAITGKENKNGTIKGKFRLLISFFNDAYGLYGELQAKAGFKGTRWGEVQSGMAEQGDPSQFDSALLEAVQKALKSSRIEK